ncbi:hypothetical protein T484DRAFT_1938368, partial [Baffinella frigidus]
ELKTDRMAPMAMFRLLPDAVWREARSSAAAGGGSEKETRPSSPAASQRGGNSTPSRRKSVRHLFSDYSSLDGGGCTHGPPRDSSSSSSRANSPSLALRAASKGNSTSHPGSKKKFPLGSPAHAVLCDASSSSLYMLSPSTHPLPSPAIRFVRPFSDPAPDFPDRTPTSPLSPVGFEHQFDQAAQGASIPPSLLAVGGWNSDRPQNAGTSGALAAPRLHAAAGLSVHPPAPAGSGPVVGVSPLLSLESGHAVFQGSAPLRDWRRGAGSRSPALGTILTINSGVVQPGGSPSIRPLTGPNVIVPLAGLRGVADAALGGSGGKTMARVLFASKRSSSVSPERQSSHASRFRVLAP